MGSQACITFKSITKLNKSILSILQVTKSYISAELIFYSIQHNSKVGLLLLIHCLLFVLSALGSYVEFLVLMCGSRYPFYFSNCLAECYL